MTSAPAAPGEGEASSPRPLDPRVLTYWWTRGAIRALALSALVVAVDMGTLVPRLVPPSLPPGWVSGTAILLLVVGGAVIPPLSYRVWSFALREDDLWIRRGILIRSVTVIPYRRLQFVDTSHGPLARAFGLAELVVHTAAAGVSGRIPGLDLREAEELRERLARMESTGDDPV